MRSTALEWTGFVGIRVRAFKNFDSLLEGVLNFFRLVIFTMVSGPEDVGDFASNLVKFVCTEFFGLFTVFFIGLFFP